MHSLIRIATEVLMEVLGSVPCRSETQYLEGFLRGISELQQSGNMLQLRCRFSQLCCSFVAAPVRQVETKRQQVSTSEASIFSDDAGYERIPGTLDLLSVDALSGDQVLDDAEDALLLMPGEFADFLEDAAGFTDRPAFSLPTVFVSKQIIHRHVQHCCEL